MFQQSRIEQTLFGDEATVRLKELLQRHAA
jgi:hypothetical protein